MAVPMESILEELRAVDGELFKSEQTQRLYLLLKNQSTDSLRSVWLVSKDRKPETYQKALQLYIAWGPNLREEEMRRLRQQRGIDELWLQVAMLYVKLSHRAAEVKTVKIKTPILDELVQNFFTTLAKSPFVQTGEIWTYDAVRQDYALREIFRTSVMASVTFLEEAREVKAEVVRKVEEEREKEKEKRWKDDRERERDERSEIYPDDSISSFLDTKRKPRFANLIKDERERSDDEEEEREKAYSSSSSDDERNEREEAGEREETYERKLKDGGRTEDGATIIMRRDDRDDRTVMRSRQDDAGTVARRRDADAGSTISASTRSSGSSRFGRMQPARLLTLSSAPQLGTIEERVVQAQIVEEEEEEEKPIVVSLPSGTL